MAGSIFEEYVRTGSRTGTAFEAARKRTVVPWVGIEVCISTRQPIEALNAARRRFKVHLGKSQKRSA
jgi:hypothetical protein